MPTVAPCWMACSAGSTLPFRVTCSALILIVAHGHCGAVMTLGRSNDLLNHCADCWEHGVPGCPAGIIGKDTNRDDYGTVTSKTSFTLHQSGFMGDESYKYYMSHACGCAALCPTPVRCFAHEAEFFLPHYI